MPCTAVYRKSTDARKLKKKKKKRLHHTVYTLGLTDTKLDATDAKQLWLQLRQCFYSLDRPPYATPLQPAETLLSKTVKLNLLQPAISPQDASKHDKMNVWYSSSKHLSKQQACWHPLNWLGLNVNWNVSDALWFQLSPQPRMG